MNLTQVSTASIVTRIGRLQQTQSLNPPTSGIWNLASLELSPLFKEMARRQKLNNNEGDWHRWTARLYERDLDDADVTDMLAHDLVTP